MKNKKHFNSLLLTSNIIMQLLCFHWGIPLLYHIIYLFLSVDPYKIAKSIWIWK